MKPISTALGWRVMLAALIAALAIYAVALVGYSWAAECTESETARLRYLVQLYASQRTDTEFALAKAETERQRLERRVRELEDAILKMAPKG